MAGVIASTLAVVVTWALVGALLLGIGASVRRSLQRLAGALQPARLARADVWIGLAALVAFLELWNLALPVDGLAWVPPLALAIAALVPFRRPPRPRRPSRRAFLLGALVATGVAWVANLALALPGDSDDGLYHLGIILYARRYAAIPGLGNLASRLASGDPHLLLAAFLDQGPWAGAGWHLPDGLLAALLFVELGIRLARPAGAGVFTRRLAVLLALATVVCIGIRPTHRITSPNLDFAAFVLVAVGMLYLAGCVEEGFHLPEGIAALGALTTAAATRPLFWVPALMAALLLAWLAAAPTRGSPVLALRRVGGLMALPGLVLGGLLARQAVLSGYPLYPLAFAGLPVDWRMPSALVTAANNVDDAWARNPNAPEATVLASWGWVGTYWWPYVSDDVDVVLPVALLGSLAPSLLAGRAADPSRARRTRPMLAVVVPSLAALVLWFLTAPDPRFVFAPLWLVPAALVAWALPSWSRGLASRDAALAAGAGLATGVALAATLGRAGLGGFAWLPRVELGLWVYLAGLAFVLRRRVAEPLLARAALLSALLLALGVVALRQHGFMLVDAHGRGPFRTPLEPVPRLTAEHTRSGLRVWVALGGSCDGVLLCSPGVPPVSPQLRLRGETLASGFTLDP